MTADRVPGPPGRWLVGDMENYLADRIGWLEESRNRYGDVVRIAPGLLVTHDPDTAHSVLTSTNDTYLLETSQLAGRRRREQAMSRIDNWMAVRRNIWHGFAEQLADSHLSRLTADATKLLDLHAGTSADLVDTCRHVSGRLIVDFCLGGDPGQAGLLSDVASRANALFTTALSVLQEGEARWRWWPRPRAAAAATADQELRALIADCIAERRASAYTGTPRDLLDALLSGVKSGDDSDGMLVSVLRMAMFASHGVPGAALSWIVVRLATHPEIAEAVRAEATKWLASGASDPGSEGAAPRGVGGLEFTAATISEVLRLHPPQWLLTRTAMRDTAVGGYALRSGQQILICPYVIHRDARFWPEPHTFDPSRWLGNQRGHARHAYLPFGAGPRVCPGSALALRQLSVLTAVLLRDHEVRVPTVDEVPVSCDGLLLPTGVRGGWERRQTAA